MSPDTENFESLRKLLTLKRYEQPPPGYFHNFSRDVIARIKAGDNGEPARSAFWELSWLQRVWGALEAKPVLAGGFGVAVCGALVFGAVYSGNDKMDAAAMDSATQQSFHSEGLQIANNSPSDAPVSAQPLMLGTSDGAGVMRTMSTESGKSMSLFDLVPTPQPDRSTWRVRPDAN